MRKCDSCGKVVVNEQDYMCPHCGAVTRKHCDHQKHLPDDKYNRANDYRTTAAEHSSKTYDYEKAPRTDASQKFDINDLANIKNAEDAKRIAKKAFIEQDQNGRKKFKPLAIVLIVIFAVNIFGNLLGALGDGIDDVFEELEYAFEDVGNADYTFGEDKLTHNFYVSPIVKGGRYDKENDCLEITCSDYYFEFSRTYNEDYDVVTEEWSDEFTFPASFISSGEVRASYEALNEKQVEDRDAIYNTDSEDMTAYGEITDYGIIKIYGLTPSINRLSGNEVYIRVSGINVIYENVETNEKFEYLVSLPVEFIKINADNSIEFYNIYADYDVVINEKLDLNDQYVPDEYIEHIELSDANAYNDNIFESIPASVEYTETVTLVD
jgi:hypothetical protein